MTNTYKHIFFDLDHTLWDFAGNSRKTMRSLFLEFDLLGMGVPNFDHFMDTYEKINEELWVLYRAQKIDKPTLRNGRFPMVLEHWGIVNEELSTSINERYLTDGPKQPGLMPNALETLDYLKANYKIHLITNGFKEVQATKLQSSGLQGYFETI
ncbi:MAG: HAD hydrolase-like protein, partial [Bacteroidia bacterium]|nr:HAD hydrolase-like protein [Bacteroidia bacterium]